MIPILIVYQSTWNNKNLVSALEENVLFLKNGIKLIGINLFIGDIVCCVHLSNPSATRWMPCYLPITEKRIFGFIPFIGVLARFEIQTASFRIWTRVVGLFSTILTETRLVGIVMCIIVLDYLFNRPMGILVRVCKWSGRPGYSPRSSHVKDFKKGTWCHLV